jgi:hypothetical protein
LLEGKTPYNAGATFSEDTAMPGKIPDVLVLDSSEAFDLSTDALVALDVEAALVDNDFDNRETQCVLPE